MPNHSIFFFHESIPPCLKKYLKCKFRFSTLVFLTRTYKYAVSKMLFGETLFVKKTEFQNRNFCFKNHCCVPRWWIIPKQSTLFGGEQNSMKKTISSKYNFCFLSWVNRTTTDNNVIYKLLLKKHFLKENYFLKNLFLFYHHSCVPPLMNRSKPTNFWRKTNFIDENTFHKI